MLYDFQAVAEDELSLAAGSVVTITDTEQGQGWWLALDSSGQQGKVPETYCEREGGPEAGNLFPSWGDDWDSDEEEHRYEDPHEVVPAQPVQPAPPLPKVRAPSAAGVEATEQSRFSLAVFTSTYGKRGQVADYLTGLTEGAAVGLASQAVGVQEAEGGYFWAPAPDPFTCAIGPAKKGSKFMGAKSFIEYPVTPSFSKIRVHRRYKHFDWLHDQLCGKFGSLVAIPPLPDKSVAGRFDEALIEHRRVELQSFVDRICRHPVLANSEVWKHFITTTDERKWTAGKRKAEADPLVGVNFLTTLQAPSILPDTEQAIDEKIFQFGREIVKTDAAVKVLADVAETEVARYKSSKKDCQDIGKAWAGLGAALGPGIPQQSSLIQLGACYEEISGMYDKQAEKDWLPIEHLMHDYKGLVDSWQDILGLHRGMTEKHREIMKTEGGEREKDCSVSTHQTVLFPCVRYNPISSFKVQLRSESLA